jgi:hypothetical protein
MGVLCGSRIYTVVSWFCEMGLQFLDSEDRIHHVGAQIRCQEEQQKFNLLREETRILRLQVLELCSTNDDTMMRCVVCHAIV